jgi:hypothetical protein
VRSGAEGIVVLLDDGDRRGGVGRDGAHRHRPEESLEQEAAEGEAGGHREARVGGDWDFPHHGAAVPKVSPGVPIRCTGLGFPERFPERTDESSAGGGVVAARIRNLPA